MFRAEGQMRTTDRPPLRFDAIVLPAPDGWTGWGQLRVTALNHAAAAADLRRICRKLRLGGRIVSMIEVAEFNADTGRDGWPASPRGGNMRCSAINEYRVPAAGAGQPGTATFDVLIRPGWGISKLGYAVDYHWADRPDRAETGHARP
ncbi:hypothetical protein [Paracoccus luteus]|uniref:hypothetical protein n=1 Tax=Paracoccus luteus TaxID=2508543 RepID=UPI0010704F5B|nr:hypothetical protein [Paracoccus luteus]